jgi:hypothetical protein
MSLLDGIIALAKEGCGTCGKRAAWVRRTQFSGNFFFCVTHAELENDFSESDPSYFYWEELASTTV